MVKVLIYTRSVCPYCDQAKALLKRYDVAFEEVNIDADPSKAAEMMEKSQRRTVPQIFINDEHIGGCDDLYALERAGKLKSKLES
ncbi:MAG: glutaredoxin [Gammaproteobacteria bacterium]|jgi:glutaredoxin 3|nr:glutaredoxin [Gammaproteobacteria bacterium]